MIANHGADLFGQHLPNPGGGTVHTRPDPTAPGYSGTYTLQAEYKIHQENRSTMQVTPAPLTQPPEADIGKPLDSTTKLPLVRSQQPKQFTFQVAEMLTSSEIEQLRQEQNDRLDL